MRTRASVRTGIFDLQPLELRRFLTTAFVDSNNVLQIDGSSAGDTITVTQLSSGRVTVSGVVASDGLLRRFDFGSGTGFFERINIDGLGGSDRITLSTTLTNYLSSTINGGTGNDTLTGGNRRDTFNGGDGDDLMDGGASSDVFFGDAGLDTVNYSSRTTGLTFTIDNAANDGTDAEFDNIRSGTEEIIGGAGADEMTGSSVNDYLAGGAGGDTIHGGLGNDRLTGSTGRDNLQGQDGTDFLQAKNVDADTVNGGAGTDAAEIDEDLDTQSLVATLSSRVRAALEAADATNPSALDTSYDDDGKQFGPDIGSGRPVSVVAPDGSVIFAARGFNDDTNSVDILLFRYTPAGEYDLSFGNSAIPGVAFLNFSVDGGPDTFDEAFGINLDSQGRIVVVGRTTPLNAEGSPIGDGNTAVARFLADGTPDDSFGNIGGGRTVVDAGSGLSDEGADVVVDSAGRLVIAGSRLQTSASSALDFVVVRLLDTGTPDNLFDGDGIVVLSDADSNDRATAIALQTFGDFDGGFTQSIVVGGTTGTNPRSFRLARFNPVGGLDTSFGTAGISDFGFNDSALNDIAVASNNDIAAVGSSRFVLSTTSIESPMLVAYSPTGTPLDAVVEVDAGRGRFNAVAFDEVGRILAGGGVVVDSDRGDEDFYVQRYVLDPSDGLATDPAFLGPATADFQASDFFVDDAVTSLRALPDGKTGAGGYTDECGDGCLIPAAARWGGGRRSAEAELTDVETIISYDDVQTDPQWTDGLSATARMYVLAQPDDDGRAVVPLNPGSNTVSVGTMVGEGGENLVFVNVNGVFIHYEVEHTTMITINGNSGADVIQAASDVLIPLHINGGAGNDQLLGGGGDDVVDGGAGNDSVGGGGGNDVLLGRDGSDNVTGDAGNDIAIGGAGADKLNGGTGDDILLAGTTAHDDDLAALEALMAEWGQTTPYAVRVANLKAGTGANGPFVLTPLTVFNDTSADVLTGNVGNDWFFARTLTTVKDRVMDRAAGEFLDEI